MSGIVYGNRAEACTRLRRTMAAVRDAGAYYASIPPGDGAEREFTARESIDPDGRTRDLLSEQEQYLRDLHEEITFLRERAWLFYDSRPFRLIDIGCGYGRLLSALRYEYLRYGVEPSEHAASYARDHGTIHVGTIETLPESWRDFDAAVLYHVIEHATDPVALLRRTRELLRPGCMLLVGTPDFDSPMARRYRDRFRLLHDPSHTSLFSTDSLLRCLRDLGFDVTRIDFPFPARLDTDEARAAAERAGVSPPARGNIVTMYAQRT